MTGEPLPQHLNSNLASICDYKYFCHTFKVETRNECSVVLLVDTDTDADAGFGVGALGSNTEAWTLFLGHVVLRLESGGQLGNNVELSTSLFPIYFEPCRLEFLS